MENAGTATESEAENESAPRSETGLKRKPEGFLPVIGQATLQPPLPLQLFLPLQPISPVVQPPLPLQLFMPLQSCLSVAVLDEDTPDSSLEVQPVLTMVPASNPAMAAEMTNVLAVLDILFSFQFYRLTMNDRRPSATRRGDVFVV
jgi:hypothetical protein